MWLRLSSSGLLSAWHFVVIAVAVAVAVAWVVLAKFQGLLILGEKERGCSGFVRYVPHLRYERFVAFLPIF